MDVPGKPICFASCVLPAWWPSAKRSDPIPSRTRPSNASAPMVLCLKTWESRSSPGLQNAKSPSHVKSSKKGMQRGQYRPNRIPFAVLGAGWSSPVARQAHNLKVISSNLVPATKISIERRLTPKLWPAAQRNKRHHKNPKSKPTKYKKIAPHIERDCFALSFQRTGRALKLGNSSAGREHFLRSDYRVELGFRHLARG